MVASSPEPGGGAVGRGGGPSARALRSSDRRSRRCEVTRFVYGIRAISRAFLTARATSRCCFSLLPVFWRVFSLARSETNLRSMSVSL